jgi:hypothetical protein
MGRAVLCLGIAEQRPEMRHNGLFHTAGPLHERLGPLGSDPAQRQRLDGTPVVARLANHS